MNESKVMINGKEVLDKIQELSKEASEKHKNHAYWKGLKDVYNIVQSMVIQAVMKEDYKNGSDETGRSQAINSSK